MLGGPHHWLSPRPFRTPAVPAPDPVHAVLTLSDSAPPQGVTVASIQSTLSHPPTEPLFVTLDNGATIAFEIGETEAESGTFAVTPGGEPYVVAVESYSGGGFTSLDVTDTATVTPGAAAEPVRVYKGSLVYSTSGSVTKEAIAAESFMSGVNLAASEIEFEAIGGGQSGGGTSAACATSGGLPGLVAKAVRAWADVPSTVTYTVGAGGFRASNAVANGGTSSVSGIVSAAGGSSGTWDPKDRAVGPGAGARCWYTNPGNEGYSAEEQRGGRSNDADPALRLNGGTPAGSGSTTNGLNAQTPFQHGSGGASFSGGATPGGLGGWPGGGGGKGGFNNTYGHGGGGAVRLHIYAWEVPA